MDYDGVEYRYISSVVSYSIHVLICSPCSSPYNNNNNHNDNQNSLTRLEMAEEAHGLYLQRILTDNSSIASAVMIGQQGGGGSGGGTTTTATAGSTSTSHQQHATGNPTTSTTTTNTPRRRARRSESSSNASGNGGTSTTSGSTSDAAGANALDVAAIGGSPHATSSSQPERFWNRSRREDSVIL